MVAEPRGHILLGVTGGIAAYKSADIVRRLKERGYAVRVLMSAGAREFVTPLTLQAVSGEPVHHDLLDERAEAGMGHIELARWADVVLIAPATANCMAKLAGGHADDLLSTLCLATTAPVVLAPAMNQQMWLAPATQRNLARLREDGVRILGPGEGSQACGEVGPGRMLDPADIADQLTQLAPLARAPSAPGLVPPGPAGALSGLRLLVTAGPTREAIDPVRYISNHSSGKMGYAIAAAAARLGARVTLVSGPTALAAPSGVEVVAVTSAGEMHDAVLARAAAHDVFVAAAAVADYRPSEAAPRKLKKTAATLTFELVRTPDILTGVARLPNPPFTVGFAAETDDLEANAMKKLRAKGLDLIAGNDVSAPGIGFEQDENALILLWEGGRRDLLRASKAEIARALLEFVAERYHAKRPAAHPR